MSLGEPYFNRIEELCRSKTSVQGLKTSCIQFMSLFEVTLVVSFLTVMIYPIALALLAVNFLKKPEMLEIIWWADPMAVVDSVAVVVCLK